MKIAFTGTRRGMTGQQFHEVEKEVWKRKPTLVVHGACIGADRQFHSISHVAPLHIHPAYVDQKEWAMNHVTEEDEIFKEEPALIRNQAMVNKSDLVIAAPKGKQEEQRSGTWATIRYARRIKKHLIIVWPDGTTTEENV